jgi:hypothetical protein
MTSSHSLDRLGVEFDDPRVVVGDAGLVLAATLMQHLGLEELFGEHLELGEGEAGANVGRKALTVIASVLAGTASMTSVRCGRRDASRCRGTR